MNAERFLGAVKKIFPRRIFLFLRPGYHFLLSFLAALFYGFPARCLVVIGITGTKGKTTAVELVHEILQEGGFRVASMSSLRFRTGDKEELNGRKMTMPGRFFVQKFLHQALRAGCKYAVLEVTSEGIKQFRHRFIRFHAAALTNVAPEHIESHGGFERYLRAKLDLFWRTTGEGAVVINRDDPSAERFLAATSARRIFYGKDGIEYAGKKFSIRDARVDAEGVSFEINGTAIQSKLLGEFNFYNIVCAVALGLGQHVAAGKIARAIARVRQIPGRMEFVQKEPFAAVVDYAHTPDSLRNVYTFLRGNPKPETRNPKLICVLGSQGGGRDKWKRSAMGKVASEFCEQIIITNEDPYDDDPAKILADIKSGVTSNKLPVTKIILDRREAIKTALRLAKPDDTVIITGKGAEPWIMGSKGSKTPWDDRVVVREELKRL